ncbi:MAG: phosphatase PAP2 family protein [Tissierellia bacterium]|nr:phosphatase PAP2 family protein [Tissierellia bacterium]
MIKKKSVFTIIVLIIGIIFGFYIKGYGGLSWEINIDKYLSSLFSNNYLIPKIFTYIGNSTTYILLLLGLFIYSYRKKNYKLFLTILFIVLITSVWVQGMKFSFYRVRPENFMVIKQGGYSFPSGHAATSMAICLSIRKIYKNFKDNKVIDIILLLLPIFIGLSRLILGVHWPTDVMYGWILGYTVYIWLDEIYKKIYGKELI